MRRILYYMLLLALSLVQTITAQQITLSQNSTISLLTCTPGNETYSKYGHSAIRVCDPEQDIDYTFNYGVFNFNTKDFYLKFVRGETWYQLDVEDTDWFIYTSSRIGRTTYEQVLNLTHEQRQALLDKLLDNYQQKNRYYLYNFVFDNCATRPYHLIKQVVPDIENTVLATPLPFEGSDATPTYRQLVRHYSEPYSWPKFGIDFIFGADADKRVLPERRLFMPEQLMNLMKQGAYSDGSPLILSDDSQEFVIGRKPWWISPYMLIVLLIALMTVMTMVDLRRGKTSLWFDSMLWVGGVILSIVVCYLSFFSIHPLVKHNLNLLVINPLLLVPIVMTMFHKSRKWLLSNIALAGICILVLSLVRIACISVQAWHWIIAIPIVHSVRLMAIGHKQLYSLCSHIVSKRTALLASAIALCATINAEQRLTVVVCVDGLNRQALGEMRGYWQQGGLRTLDEEAHESTLSFPHLIYGGCESVATIMTGVTPDEHGITSNRFFDRKDRKVKNIFTDTSERGIGTDLQLSPKALIAPTLADEFRMRHSDRSKIYAIGIHPETTILLAGHAANACTWLEQNNQCWATTGYYSEGLPAAADEINISGRISTLVSQPWTPRMEPTTYMHPTATEKKNGFSYQQKDVLLQSPAANTLVIELALALQKSAALGLDKQADLLMLELTVNSPAAQSDLIETAEQEDMYIRLNQDLGWLMEQLEKRIGKDNFRLILFGKPQLGTGRNTLQRANLQTGWFNTERTAALCNTYLMAVYGHERWIDGGFCNSIFLNRTLIEQKKMKLYDIQRQVSSFLLEFEGTKAAYPFTDVMLLPNGGEQEKLRCSLNKHTAGDVVFLLESLWLTGENEKNAVDCVADQEPVAPLLFWTTNITAMPERDLKATDVKEIILK
ncbi:MAG: DUF4105 domain-containing protein [Paludibacteraceae bacterium]|nr:DUF4105 domain-containing protein [Paludibacteraceae bacterium]